MVFASGGRLFNDALDPVFPNEDKTAVAVLEWLVEAMHSWEILDPKGLELDETQARDVFLSGQGVFTLERRQRDSPRQQSAAQQTGRRHRDDELPRPKGRRQGPDGMDATILHWREDQGQERGRWRLIYYMGGKDGEGNYYTAKDWYLKYGVGYAFKSLDNDADIVEAQRKAGYDREMLSSRFGTARARENIGAPWYNDWDRFTQQQIQNALLRRIKPHEALVASANKAQDLKKSS